MLYNSYISQLEMRTMSNKTDKKIFKKRQLDCKFIGSGSWRF